MPKPKGEIDNAGIYNSLMSKLNVFKKSLYKGNMNLARNNLNAFMNEVMAQSGKHITAEAAALLLADAQWVKDHLATSNLQAIFDTSYEVFLPAIGR